MEVKKMKEEERKETNGKVKVFNRGNFSIAALAGKEESWGDSPQSKLHITPEFTEVTNGHYLLQVSRPEVEKEEIPNGRDGESPIDEPVTMLMSRDRALQIEKAIPKNGNHPILNNAWPVNQTDNSVSFLTTDLQKEDVIKAEKEDGRYPATDIIWPKDNPVIEIGFNPDYMIKLCQQFKKNSSAREPRVKLTIYGDKTAMKLEAAETETEQEVKALLMPCAF